MIDSKIIKVLLIALSFIWLGMLIGISFLEAPLKFQAPSITLAVALEIGKIVFHALNIVELIISALIIISLISIKSDKTIWILYSFPVMILAIQSIWILPELMQRADTVIANKELSKSNAHIIYAIFEGLKFIAILIAGITFTKRSIK